MPHSRYDREVIVQNSTSKAPGDCIYYHVVENKTAVQHTVELAYINT